MESTLGELMVRLNVIDAYQLRAAEGFQRQWGHTLARSVVELGLVDEEGVLRVMSLQHKMPYVRLSRARVTAEAVQRLPEPIARRFRAVPMSIMRDGRRPPRLLVAIADPTDIDKLDALRFAANMEVEPVLAGELDIEGYLNRTGIDRAESWR